MTIPRQYSQESAENGRPDQETAGRAVDADTQEVDAQEVDARESGTRDTDARDAGIRDAGARDTRAADMSAADAGTEQRERLVPVDHAESYGSRWDAVKGTFVDEPREAVAQADALVGEVLDELENLFREQRRGIERGLDSDETSTEDLRLALRRYRSFFDRLLSV